MKFKLEENNPVGIYSLQLDEGFKFTPKINSPIVINDITIYDQDLIGWFIYNRFMNKYKKLVALVISLLHDDTSTDSDIKIALDEIEHQKQVIAVKYHKLIKKHEQIEYFKKLEYLEIELKNKYLIKNIMNNMELSNNIEHVMEERKGKSR